MKLLIILVLSVINLEAYNFSYQKKSEDMVGQNQTTLKTADVNVIDEICSPIGLKKQVIIDVIEKYHNIIIPNNPNTGPLLGDNIYINQEDNTLELSMDGETITLGSNAVENVITDGKTISFNGSSNNGLGLDSTCMHELKSIEVYIISTEEGDYVEQAIIKDNEKLNYINDKDRIVGDLITKAQEIFDLNVTKNELAENVTAILLEMTSINTTLSEINGDIDDLKDEVENLNKESDIVALLLTELDEKEKSFEYLSSKYDQLDALFQDLVSTYSEIQAEITEQSEKLTMAIDGAGTICDLRRIVAEKIAPEIEEMKEYDARYLKGKIQIDKLIHIDY